MFAGNEQYKALTDEFEKLKELLVISEAAIQQEKQLSVGLAEEIKELKGMLQQAELKCADLYERNSDFEAAVGKESNEMIQLLEERRALEKTVQSQAERCMVLEGQISQLEENLREGCENSSRLLQEIQELKEKLHNDIEVSTQVLSVWLSLCFELNQACFSMVGKLASMLLLSQKEIWKPIL